MVDDSVRELLTRGTAEAREKFESGICRWGVGACYLSLTAEQYNRLRLIALDTLDQRP